MLLSQKTKMFELSLATVIIAIKEILGGALTDMADTRCE